MTADFGLLTVFLFIFSKQLILGFFCVTELPILDTPAKEHKKEGTQHQSAGQRYDGH
jgi:hypothetical protein